ncbi:MAG TPA: DUF1549 and DUF1553 domain-containing protein [Pirellulales bacterium]|nr:DUF1549 and DUF1553 domain-containing protein [Pirellulales bacterium]
MTFSPMRIWKSPFAFIVALALSGGDAFGDVPISKVEVFPPDVELSTKLDRQKFIVVATRADGVTLDVTSQSQATLADPALAKIEGATVYPLADGQTMLQVAFGGQTLQVPVTVKQAAADRPISFQLDVMPVFMRAGCNTGSCHGAARGKDGFRLSLFGFDPAGDHFRLTRELGCRRINLALPAESLLMEKADGTVPHTGGKRFERDSEYYGTLLRWLEAGAPYDASEVAKVLEVELYPKQVVLEGAGATQQMIARAKYSDGTDRDVTSLAVFLTNNDNSAAITPDGLVTAANRGEAFVMARFETHTVGSQVLALPKDLQYTPPSEPPVNYVDELVNAKLQKLRILPSDVCSDEVFLRRVTIDITGLLPTEQEYAEFVADQDPAKRARLVDRLLDRKEFSEIWAMKWAELLTIRSTVQVSTKSAYLYANWLSQQIQNNVPLDKMVQDLLGASGGTFKNPATNYYQVETDTLKTAENVAQVFMGIRTQCAQCHNHPFDRWTMNDYYSFAAFFAQIGRKQGEDYREIIVFNSGGGDVRHLVDGRVMPPKFLGGPQPDLAGKDRRAVLSQWLASPENAYFATSVANRVWDHFFGVGIVNPVDDVRISNPASNPELYKALGDKLTSYNYDFKQLVRDICNSKTYQRASERNASNDSDELNFAHSRIRRVRAENLLDCISQATEAKDKFPGLPLGSRATQIADGGTSTYFLTTFGRSTRNTVCSCEVKTEPNLSQSLHMLNGDTIEGKIRNGGLIQRLLKEGKTPDQVMETIYVRCLTRKPTADELAKVKAAVAQEQDPQKALEDVFWAVLNSREFVFNH